MIMTRNNRDSFPFALEWVCIFRQFSPNSPRFYIHSYTAWKNVTKGKLGRLKLWRSWCVPDLFNLAKLDSFPNEHFESYDSHYLLRYILIKWNWKCFGKRKLLGYLFNKRDEELWFYLVHVEINFELILACRFYDFEFEFCFSKTRLQKLSKSQ